MIYFTADIYYCQLGPDSIWRCCLTSIGNSIVEIRRSYDCLISIMGFPILVRWHLYIESGPWTYQTFKYVQCYLLDSPISTQFITFESSTKWWTFHKVFKCISLKQNFCILIEISRKFVPMGLIENNSMLARVKAWCQKSSHLATLLFIEKVIQANNKPPKLYITGFLCQISTSNHGFS